jgi:uncharacterized membrane protein SpoIIM required for sporulation
MAALLSGIILVLALAVAAGAGIALLVGLYRVSGRRSAGTEPNHAPHTAAEPPAQGQLS